MKKLRLIVNNDKKLTDFDTINDKDLLVNPAIPALLQQLQHLMLDCPEEEMDTITFKTMDYNLHGMLSAIVFDWEDPTDEEFDVYYSLTGYAIYNEHIVSIPTISVILSNMEKWDIKELKAWILEKDQIVYANEIAEMENE
ncbi:hypothetical protein [Cytobacillus kochii]|uniref:Uncharacterized protein n=1 Tax=Cytobacillus kochii TaxID=859143 RepID=A0A248TLQ1_9BACI|nr:hypothetical protein [Cytobacillus kochii]ASV69075.1 hypothetical protein CKF48_18280 [Cytobacillus kochii]